jgi:ArsR family transcriptional regulator
MTRTLDILKALADGNRLRILAALLRVEELCACQIIDLLGVSGATTSRHLALLANAGLVTGRRAGRWIHYRLAGNVLDDDLLIQWLSGTLSMAPELERDRGRLAEILSCRPEDICARQRVGSCCG